MARASFGGGVADFVVAANAPGDPIRFAAATLTMWSAETGGTHYTDLVLDGDAVTQIPVGTDGQIPTFQGPDEVLVMWAQAGSGARVMIDASGDLALRAGDAADRAETAAGEAEGFGGTNNTQVAGFLGAAGPSKTVLDASIDGAIDAATVAMRTGPRVSALITSPPVVIPHRGACAIYPEGVLDSYERTLALGLQAMEVGDIQACADGGLFDVHDSTVDRTTTGSGAVSSFSTPGMQSLIVDPSSFFSTSYANLTGVPDFGQVLTRIGGRTVAFLEVKDLLDSTATAMALKIKELGLQDSVVLGSFVRSNLEVAAAAGLYKAFYAGSIPGDTPAQLVAAGVNFYAINHRAAGDLTGHVAAMKAAGLKVYAYSLAHQYDYDVAMSKGFDGVFSDDPLYTARLYSRYRRSQTTWHQDGAFSHGMSYGGDAPWSATLRGGFVGGPGGWRWQPARNGFNNAGPVNPVPSPAGSYTITVKAVFDALPSSTSQGPTFAACAPNDLLTNLAGNVPLAYMVKARATGQIQIWTIDAAGAATSLGSISTTAPSIPTLSSGLTAGAAVTSIPVNALTVALKVGHQFVLPTGQTVTLTSAAAIGATALAVSSVTPSAAVASGASLLPLLTITLAVTPTNLTLARADETSVSALVAANTANRGAYIALMNYVDTGNTSFLSVGVA